MAVFEVYAGDILIHHSQSPSPDVKLLNPKLTMEVSAAGSFTCKVPPTNIGYDKIDRLTTEITVKKDGNWLWSGRIISEEMDFWNNRTITCEGELAYLNDTTQPPAEYHDKTVRGFLQTLLSVHNLKNHLRSGYAYEIKFDRNSSMGNNYKFGAIWRLQDGKYAYFDYTANINGSKTIWVPCTSDFYFEVMRDKSSSSSSTIWGWKIESINIIQNEFIYDDTDFIDGIPYTGTENIEKYSVNNNLEGLESSHPYYSSMNQLWHINMVGNKDFMVGAVTVTDPNDSLYRYTNFESTLEDIKDKMIDRLGGYLRLRKENGIRWIDYLAEPLNTNSQVIEFGKNLLDFSKSWDLSDFATVVIPQGAMLDESPIEALDAYLDVSSVNNGSIYVFDQSIVDTYGWIEVVVSWSDVTVASNLLSKAKKYLSDIQFDNMELELSAVDMSYMMGADSIEMIKLLDKIHCISKPHGMDRYFPVTKIEIPIDNPENTTFTLGNKIVKTSLSASIKSGNQEIIDKINSIPSTTSTMDKILNEADENAKQIMNQVTNGYITIETVETVDGIHSEALYVRDQPTEEDSTRYWKWNVNGLAYYKNKEEIGVAITMDGAIKADFITTGTLDAKVIRAGTIEDSKGYNYWNLDTGDFRMSSAHASLDGSSIATQTYASKAASTAVSNYNTSLNQTAIFNKLTNNGAIQGLYMDNGQLYINASYINTGIITNTNGRMTIDLTNGKIITQGNTYKSGDYTYSFYSEYNGGELSFTSKRVGTSTLTNRLTISCDSILYERSSNMIPTSGINFYPSNIHLIAISEGTDAVIDSRLDFLINERANYGEVNVSDSGTEILSVKSGGTSVNRQYSESSVSCTPTSYRYPQVTIRSSYTDEYSGSVTYSSIFLEKSYLSLESSGEIVINPKKGNLTLDINGEIVINNENGYTGWFSHVNGIEYGVIKDTEGYYHDLRFQNGILVQNNVWK